MGTGRRLEDEWLPSSGASEAHCLGGSALPNAVHHVHGVLLDVYLLLGREADGRTGKLSCNCPNRAHSLGMGLLQFGFSVRHRR